MRAFRPNAAAREKMAGCCRLDTMGTGDSRRISKLRGRGGAARSPPRCRSLDPSKSHRLAAAGRPIGRGEPIGHQNTAGVAGWNGRPPSAKGNLDKSGRRIVLTAPVNLATGNCIWGERHPSSYQHQVPGTVPDSIGARVARGVQQHRALRLLADALNGRAVADMCFTNALLDRRGRYARARGRRNKTQPTNAAHPVNITTSISCTPRHAR
jgi:hypothetical protein